MGPAACATTIIVDAPGKINQKRTRQESSHEAGRQRAEARCRTAARRVEVRAHQVEHGYRADHDGGAESGQDLDAERPALPLDSRQEAEAERDDQDRDDRRGRQEQAGDQQDGKQHVPQ